MAGTNCAQLCWSGDRLPQRHLGRVVRAYSRRGSGWGGWSAGRPLEVKEGREGTHVNKMGA